MFRLCSCASRWLTRYTCTSTRNTVCRGNRQTVTTGQHQHYGRHQGHWYYPQQPAPRGMRSCPLADEPLLVPIQESSSRTAALGGSSQVPRSRPHQPRRQAPLTLMLLLIGCLLILSAEKTTKLSFRWFVGTGVKCSSSASCCAQVGSPTLVKIFSTQRTGRESMFTALDTTHTAHTTHTTHTTHTHTTLTQTTPQTTARCRRHRRPWRRWRP